MGQSGELALHPHELARILDRLLLGLRHVTANQIAALLGSGLIADPFGSLVVELPDLLTVLDGRVQDDVGVTVLSRPDDRLPADHAGDPDAWMGLLQGQHPGVDDPELIVIPLPAEWPGLGPRLDDQVVRLHKPLTVVGRVGICGQGFHPTPADEARDQPPLRDHIDHGQFFGQPYRIVRYRQGIAQEDDFHPFGHRRQDRGEDVHFRLHAEGRVVMLIEHDAIDADLFRIEVLLQPFVVEPAACDRIEKLVWEEERSVPELLPLLLRVSRHGLLGKVHQVHRGPPFRRMRNAECGMRNEKS